MDVAAAPEPHAPDLLKIGMINAQKLAFGDALRDLDAAAAEVAKSGGAGMSTEQLSDLYLFRAMATARVDWNRTAAAFPWLRNPFIEPRSCQSAGATAVDPGPGLA